MYKNIIVFTFAKQLKLRKQYDLLPTRTSPSNFKGWHVILTSSFDFLKRCLTQHIESSYIDTSFDQLEIVEICKVCGNYCHIIF
jgi:hypothetical protein